MQTALRHLETHPSISPSSKRSIVQYLTHLEDQGRSLARRVTHLVRLTRIAETLGKPLDSADEEDMRLLMRNLRSRKTTRTTSPTSTPELSLRSICDYQNTVRKFWRWLKAPSDRQIDPGWNPPETG
jgi:hypothetical protein